MILPCSSCAHGINSFSAANRFFLNRMPK
jgi:hypothetical protein